MKERYSKEAANYAERPKAKGFGCFPRCEYGGVAEGKDKDGREIWCGQFGVHVRAKACCAFEDGKDLVQIEAGGPGSGCNPDVGKCGRPEGPQTDYMATKLGGPKGTNPGGLYKGSDGIERYIKIYEDPKSARGEALSNHIYHDLGLSVPKSELFEHDGKLAIASVVVPPSSSGGKTLKEYSSGAPNGVSGPVAQVFMRGFAADVLTANWDAVGLAHDNVVVSKFGTPYRVDQGGTLLKRAQGGDKPENTLHQITEVEKFFDKSKNAAYAQVAEAAGIKSVADMKAGFEQQVKAITDLRQAAGGWQKYVAMQSPEMPKEEQQKIAGMLEARTNLMQSKVYELDNKPKQKEADKPEPTEAKDSKWRQYNPNAVGGYFRQGTAIASIYQTLTAKEGQWHSVAEIKKTLEGKTTANIDSRFTELKYTGKRSGMWSVEISGDNARIFLTKAGDVKQTELSDVKVKIAEDFAKKAMSQGFVNNVDHAEYFNKMGVSVASRDSLEKAVQAWTSSSESGPAQNWRQVAMKYYNREPGGEFVSQTYKTIGTQNGTQKANTMRDAAMALKAYSSAYARLNKVTTVYRNISGDAAKDIMKAIREAEKTGKTKIPIPLNSLSSWSDRKDVGISSGVKIRMKIDPDNVWAIHEASSYLFSAHKGEREYVIGAHQPKEVISIADISIDEKWETGATKEEYEKYHKVFAAKDKKEDKDWNKTVYSDKTPLTNEDGVYWDAKIGPLDDDWQHRKPETKT